MKRKLITALRQAAHALESGHFPYRWIHFSTCNCGVPACALTNQSPHQFALGIKKLTADKDNRLLPPTDNFTWENLTGVFCPLTGFSEHAIFQTFRNAGLTRQDMRELENISNPKVLARVPRRFKFRFDRSSLCFFFVGSRPWKDDRTDCINYLRAWADILVEEGSLDGARVRVAEAAVAL